MEQASDSTPSQADSLQVPTRQSKSSSNPLSSPGETPQTSSGRSDFFAAHGAPRPVPPSNAKVAIPRQRTNTVHRATRRVPRACESCRQRKTKCSGDTPVCRQCRELRVHCQYPVSWRERTKKQMDRLTARAHDFEALLNEIGNSVGGKTAESIRQLLDKHSLDHDFHSADPNSHSEVSRDEPEISSPSSIGSLDAIDRVEEDLNRSESSRATGYMGKNSEVVWMQRLLKEAEQRSKGQAGTWEPDMEHSPSGADLSINSMNYHLDDIDISVPEPVQMDWIPPRNIADHLFEDYLKTVHPFFPIINRPLFTAQYTTFFDRHGQPNAKWMAILNMIFAISAKHAHLTQAPWRGEEKDHLYYFTRARFLSMNGDVLFSHPDLQQVQVEGLISFYLLASDQINRAWTISALAIRSAISLGINMKIMTDSTPNTAKEARYRVWWCLYTFEHKLGIMTGRATCILDGICTSPLPIPFEEDHLQDPIPTQLLNDPNMRDEKVGSAVASSLVRLMPLNPTNGKEAHHSDLPRNTSFLKSIPPNQGLCFLYYTDLAVIAQEIIDKVYSAQCAMTPWAHIENRIGELKARIDLWYSCLPEVYDFTKKKDDDGPELIRGKLRLAFHYYSSRIILGRPCLCRRDARATSPTKNESFSHKMAVVALESAMGLLDLIPDEPDAIQLYQITPWWCVLHYMMQTVTVLLLELSFGSVHMPQREKIILESTKKGIRWLFAMSEYSTASRRAWQLCDNTLRRIAIGMEYDVEDMPSFIYQRKPESPIRAPDVDSGLPSMVSPTPYSWGDGLNATPTTNGFHQEAHGYTVPQQPPLTSNYMQDAFGLVDRPIESDTFFPYDPISGEFIRSFFPNPTDGDQKDPWME
ncbi:hypothetical protein ASPZODRAFT_127554 [Penicilliopsis zonata CBS 506.65]|uniref:Zn(2)-C6 fungal-type domain-containing protein n=1 Tax=Penicilliopsis zonata CBS 506.65 TaxID=1073090 RepID=A0A1L9SWC0_9EURO|nr:hypothetical protein ASPZODRAFT_127554 [Penicilliopsis zonata CBS 506.65]OJJ51476.1 hypothetical protein ASPZODRAFT_127554 [Penicilliopsis zonata CBS 506.65]